VILTGKSSANSLTLGRVIVLMAEIYFYLDSDFFIDWLISIAGPFVIRWKIGFI
jgi:hypothetical protein